MANDTTLIYGKRIIKDEYIQAKEFSAYFINVGTYYQDEYKQAKEFNALSKMLWKREMEPNWSS